MSGSTEAPGPPRGQDLAAGEGYVPWGAASEPEVLKEVERRLSTYGEATVRLDGYTPFPLDYDAFRGEMERVARALRAPATVDGEGFTYVLTGRPSDFSDPGREVVNRRLRGEFLHRVGGVAGPGAVEIDVRAPGGADPDSGPAAPGTRVALRAGHRVLRFVIEERSVEEIAWEGGRGRTVLTVGVALDGEELEAFFQRAHEFLVPTP